MSQTALVRKLARRRPESSLQAAVLAVVRAHGIVCWPMNRERAGSKRASHIGFKGLPDIGGVLPTGRAFFCEVKRPGQTLSPHQVGAMEMLIRAGAYTCVVHTVQEAQACAREATRG